MIKVKINKSLAEGGNVFAGKTDSIPLEFIQPTLDRYYEDMSDAEFIDEAKNYWEDHYDEVVEEVKEYADCDFKKSIEDRRSE